MDLFHCLAIFYNLETRWLTVCQTSDIHVILWSYTNIRDICIFQQLVIFTHKEQKLNTVVFTNFEIYMRLSNCFFKLHYSQHNASSFIASGLFFVQPSLYYTWCRNAVDSCKNPFLLLTIEIKTLNDGKSMTFKTCEKWIIFLLLFCEAIMK